MKHLIKIILIISISFLLLSGCTVYILDCPCKEKDYKHDKDGEYYPDFVLEPRLEFPIDAEMKRFMDTTESGWVEIK